jgi:hypothetical protein
MFHTMEIELTPDVECRFFLEWDYFHDYDASPSRLALSAEQKRQQRERDKALFLDEYVAHYSWGPYRWSYPEFEVRELIRLLDLIDFFDHTRKPENNAELETALKKAVSLGQLIPEIQHYDRGGSAASTAAPASTAGLITDGILRGVDPSSSYRSTSLLSGEPVLSGPYDPGTQELALNAARGLSSGNSGSGWFGMVEAAAGTVAGVAGDNSDTSAELAGENMLDSGDSDDSTPLGDARPFAYSEDASTGDVQDLAARGVSEAEEAECFSQYERDMDMCRALGNPMGGGRGQALCEQNAFDNYQQCRGY